MGRCAGPPPAARPNCPYKSVPAPPVHLPGSGLAKTAEMLMMTDVSQQALCQGLRRAVAQIRQLHMLRAAASQRLLHDATFRHSPGYCAHHLPSLCACARRLGRLDPASPSRTELRRRNPRRIDRKPPACILFLRCRPRLAPGRSFG